KEDQAARGFGPGARSSIGECAAASEKVNSEPRRFVRGVAGGQEVSGRLGHDDSHDRFAPAGRGHAAGLHVSVAATANQGRIADAAGSLAARSPGRSTRNESAPPVKRNGPHSTLLMHVKLRLMARGAEAACPRLALALYYQVLRPAQLKALLDGKPLGAGADQHHVLARLEYLASQANGIAHALDNGHGTGLECRAIHDHGVELDAA